MTFKKNVYLNFEHNFYMMDMTVERINPHTGDEYKNEISCENN